MFFRIASHAEIEFGSRILDGTTVSKESCIKLLYLFYQFSGMLMTARGSFEPLVFLRFVTAEQKQIVDTQELQIEQFIFDVINRSATTDDVWLNRDMVLVLNGGSDSDSTWAAAYTLSLQ